MAFQTKYGEGISRVIAAYAPGMQNNPTLVSALEVMCKGAEDHGRVAYRDEVANGVCEGLHAGPGEGLKCRKCYDAEQDFNNITAVEMEMENALPQTNPDGEV